MTDQRDKLIEYMIENIVFIIEMNTDTSRFVLDDVVSYLRERFEEILSDKLILDRKQVEEIIEKRKDNKRNAKEEGCTLYNDFLKDLNYLLTNPSEG